MGEITIKIEVGDYTFPVKANSQKEEMNVRKSAEIFNSSYYKYKERYPLLKDSKLITMSALEVITDLVAENQLLKDKEQENLDFLEKLKKELHLTE